MKTDSSCSLVDRELQKTPNGQHNLKGEVKPEHWLADAADSS